MQRNEANLDRIVRLVIAAVAAVAGFAAGPTTIAGVVLLVVAVIMLGTAATGFCPIYRMFGISSRRSTADNEA